MTGGTLEVGPHRAVFDLERGGRLASLTVGGHELLVGPDVDGLRWGSYPMAPWAGRIRHGRFRFGGVDHQLPLNLPPHAIHGTAFTSAWRDDKGSMAVELGSPWPFPARLEQRAALRPTGLSLELRLSALEQTMPAMLGWHPWFRRQVGGVDAELLVTADTMFEVDDELIPSGRLVVPTPPPWDNTFTDVRAGPTIDWPGVLELRLRSSCRFWTIYTEPEHAICVEPQTAAPDVFNRLDDSSSPDVVIEPGGSMVATFAIDWRLAGSPPGGAGS